ncbi:MAG TPA: PHB depolymerase family esterase [Myxococcota bacterium]
MNKLACGLVVALLVFGAANARADEITVDGLKRSYELFVPPGIKENAPLLVVLHGRGGTGAQVRKDSAFDEEAKKRGFAVVYPDGIDHHWNDARNLTVKAPAPDKIVDDVDFIFALVDKVAAQHGLDKARVYVAGHSNGAIMTVTLACMHADRIAGIGVVAGALAAAPMTCDLARAIPAIFFHGDEDPLVPFGGGSVGRNGARGFVLSNEATVKVFADKAGCGPAVPRAAVDNVKTDGTSIVIEDRAHCSVPVVRVVVQKGGHGWPNHAPVFLRSTQEIDATTAMAALFFDGKGP